MRYIMKLLVGCGLLAVAPGCMREYYHDTKNPFAGVVGDQDSSAPLRVGISTRDDVVARLGEPYPAYEDREHHAIAYNQYVRSGTLILWPILIPSHGGTIQPLHDEYAILLGFDANSVLTRFEYIVPDKEHRMIWVSDRFAEFRGVAKPRYGAPSTSPSVRR